jgi:hypothetical protein
MPRLWVFEVKLLTMNERSSYGTLFWSLRVGVEGAAALQSHQDLGMATFEVALKPDWIIAGIEDKQWCVAATGLPTAKTTHQCTNLFSGRIVGVFFGQDAPRVHRRDPRITDEAELRHELVGPPRYDGLPG